MRDKREWQKSGDFEFLNKTFDEFADLIDSGLAQEEDLYIGNFDIGQTVLCHEPIFAKLLDLPCFQKPYSDWRFWCGPQGHLEPMHFDPMISTLIQFMGKKRVEMYPPEATNCLYPFPVSTDRYNFSQINYKHLDTKSFPNYTKVANKRIVTDLNPGEILIIPAYWWHEVEVVQAETVTCSINRFWHMSGIDQYKAPLNHVGMRVFDALTKMDATEIGAILKIFFQFYGSRVTKGI
jgi:hypothetical protein